MLNRVEHAALEPLLDDAGVARYAPWIRNVRLFRDHQLDGDLERLLHDKEVAGRSAWIRLFDETSAALRFTIDGRELTSQEALHLLSHKDGAVRRSAAQSSRGCSTTTSRLFALVINNLAKDKEISDRWRGYPADVARRAPSRQPGRAAGGRRPGRGGAATPIRRHLAPLLRGSRRAGSVKDKLAHWDRNAPLPEDAGQGDRLAAARPGQMVLDRLRRLLAGSMAEIGRALLRRRLDRCAGARGQVARRVLASDRAERAPLHPAQLPGQATGRDDAGARARPRRAPGAGRRRRAR